MPGPTDLRGARAAGFGGGCAVKWLWRRVRMDMVELGGGIEEDSVGAWGGARVGLDWLKRRRSEVLRAGRGSAVEEVNGAEVGAGMEESGGAGKWRLFAKSSKVTSGIRLKRSLVVAGAAGGGLVVKVKWEVSRSRSRSRVWS